MAGGARDVERDYAAIALAYAKRAAADKKQKNHCKWVRLAAQRHLDDLKRAKSGWSFHFDEWHANDVCDFIEKLPHVEGSWDTDTISLEPPQVFILCVIFGWRKQDGTRRFNSVYIEMARKGAKSTLTAGVALYSLACEGEVGPQIIIGATTGEQAGKVFNPAKKMVDKTPDLQQAFGLETFVRSISCAANGGFIQPINAKGKTQDGWNPHVGILDELHAHPNRALYDVIRSAFGSRKNWLMWVITTAGYDTAGVCYEQRTFVTKVLEGVFSADHYFGIIFTLDSATDYGDGRKDGDDPFDQRFWVKANPMIGVTPTLDSMVSYAAEAKASPASEGEFKTKRLNLWLNGASRWLNMSQWLACSDPTLSWEDFEGLDCTVGGDLADKDDITALVLSAIDARGRLIFKPKFYLPTAVLAHPDHAQGKGPAPYRAWSEAGHLELTPGDWVDHNVIEAQLRDWAERFTIKKMVFDQFAAAQALASRLNEDLGTADDLIAEVLAKNAANVTNPAKDLEARVKSGPNRLRHDGNPVMNWMASNVAVSRRRDETILPIKESAMSPNKIDGIDALVNANAPLLRDETTSGSIYDIEEAWS
jgi:phage terminase large subunit-like protein